jgi:hypothetical protein
MFCLGPACLGGGGSNSKPAATIPLAPTSLVALLLTVTTARIQLTWIDNADNEFEFRIERSDDGGTTWAQVGAVPKNTLGFTDLGLLAGTTYFYRVAAWNGKGYSTFAGPVSRDTKALAWGAGLMTNGPGVGKGWHSAVYDPTHVRMIVFGGFDDLANVLDETWSYDLSGTPPGGWTNMNLTTNAPLPRLGHSAIYDPVNHRMIVFGGAAQVIGNPQLVLQNDVHVLDLTNPTAVWTPTVVTGTPPEARRYHSAIYDADNERMIVYGGKGTGFAELSDVHYLSLSGSTPAWSSPALGARPVGREQHASIYDPVGSRMVQFGGQDNEPLLDGSLFANDTWTLTAAGWSQVFFAGTPGFRMGHSAIYDAANQRLVTFGGNINPTPTPTSEMWGLKLHPTTPTWAILDPTSGSPPAARYGHSAVYDSGSNRMIIYGGFDDFGIAYDEVLVIEL